MLYLQLQNRYKNYPIGNKLPIYSYNLVPFSLMLTLYMYGVCLSTLLYLLRLGDNIFWLNCETKNSAYVNHAQISSWNQRVLDDVGKLSC